MNLVAAPGVDVPAGVLTLTSTVPVPAGLIAVSWLSVSTDEGRTGLVPKKITEVPVKPLPKTCTGVPPAAGPLAGTSPVTVGMGTAREEAMSSLRAP